MTVLDTSAVVDYLLADGVTAQVESILKEESPVAAPDVVVFEVTAVLRRDVLRRELDEERAEGALEDLGDLRIVLYPSLPLRHRAWELRRNATAADGLFIALSERLGEPLATKDAALVKTCGDHSTVRAIHLGV